MSYIFAHFTGEENKGEQIFFAKSEDGLVWTDTSEKPALVSELGTKGLRDPFIVKNEKNEKYYLIATDLNIASGTSWYTAQYEGSLNLIVYESADLVHWSNPWAVSPFGGYELDFEAGCLWAPESIYLPERDEFFVFWATMSKYEGDAEAKQRIFASYTKDFISFTEPFVYMEDSHHLIDLTIIEADGVFHRFIKDETTKAVKHDYVKNIADSQGTRVYDDVLDNIFGVEGPEIYQLENGSYCLILDRFASHEGYMPLITDDLLNGHFRKVDDTEFSFGLLKKRHGGVIKM